MRKLAEYSIRAGLAAGVIVSLGFGATQLNASEAALGCNSCQGVGPTLECELCCLGPGWCSVGHICVCG